MDKLRQSKIDRQTVFEASGGKCWYCGKTLSLERGHEHGIHPEDELVIEHQNPLSCGGEKRGANIVAACFSCNCRKGKRTLDQYRALVFEKSGAIFSPLQIQFWALRGVQLPAPPIDSIPTFYGEQR